MAVVYHFTAPDLKVERGWQSLDMFPRDGTVVEVRDAAGTISKASRVKDGIVVEPPSINPIEWRHLEEG
jgi:hypothetical protein